MKTNNEAEVTKHTPGPFFIGEIHETKAYSEQTIYTDKLLTRPFATTYAPTAGKVEANARLIAAAPELLEALTNAVAFLTRSEVQEWINRSGAFSNSYGKAVIDARAAIAKAEGKA